MERTHTGPCPFGLWRAHPTSGRRDSKGNHQQGCPFSRSRFSCPKGGLALSHVALNPYRPKYFSLFDGPSWTWYLVWGNPRAAYFIRGKQFFIHGLSRNTMVGGGRISRVDLKGIWRTPLGCSRDSRCPQAFCRCQSKRAPWSPSGINSAFAHRYQR